MFYEPSYGKYTDLKKLKITIYIIERFSTVKQNNPIGLSYIIYNTVMQII